MRNSLVILFILSILSLASCREDFTFEPSNGGLEFSKDTIYFDTIFTGISSSTYTLKVYNKSNKDIRISQIKFAKGLESKYRMTVDGMTGTNNRIFENVEMLAKDSMYIFIETTVDIAEANPSDFLYTDQIEFGSATSFQKVELVTLIQDAYFLYPQRFDNGTTETLPIGEDEIFGFYLDENDPINGNEYVWNNSKPYVIYGYAAVPSNKTLTVEAGARIHFHAESGIIVGNNASMQVNGLPSANPDDFYENRVVFEGDRLEPLYENVPGQWGTIWLTQGSKNNLFTNCLIKNGTFGLYVTGNTSLSNSEADVTLTNVEFYNHSNFGILAQTGYINGKNVVINSAGQAALACTYGGKYNFNHSTFNNNWSSSKQLSVLLNNYIEGAIPEIQPMVEATFTNCLIYGSNQIQFIIDKKDDPNFNYKFDHCLIRFNNVNNVFSNNPLYQFATDVTHYENCLIAVNSAVFRPSFFDVNSNQLIIGADSAARGQANYIYSTGTKDITDRTRENPSDIGAYNFVTFEED